MAGPADRDVARRVADALEHIGTAGLKNVDSHLPECPACQPERDRIAAVKKAEADELAARQAEAAAEAERQRIAAHVHVDDGDEPDAPAEPPVVDKHRQFTAAQKEDARLRKAGKLPIQNP